MRRLIRWLLVSLAGGIVLLALLGVWTWFQSVYGRFLSQGAYFDPVSGRIVHQGAALGYGLAAGFFCVLAIVLLIVTVRHLTVDGEEIGE